MHPLLRACSWVRLVVVGVLLAAAAVAPSAVMGDARPGLLGFVLLATVGTPAGLAMRAWSSARRAWLLALADVALVTAVVAVTGGPRTLFTSLYVLSIVTACLLLSRLGGLIMAGLASLLYFGLVVAHLLLPPDAAPPDTAGLDLLTAVVNACTFLAVAIVAGGLVDRFRDTARQLATQREDIGNLEAVRDLIFDSVDSGLVTVGRDGRITACNAAAGRMTGIAMAEAVGRPWSAVFGDEPALSAVGAIIERGDRSPDCWEIDVHRPDGTRHPVRVTFSALRSPGHERLGLIAMCDDLEKVREAEARARQADRLASLGRMAANIAHEIRNPLASMTGALEALGRPASGVETREQLTRIVLRESARLDEIIRDFLAYARPTPLRTQPGDVAEALDDVLGGLAHGTLPGRLKLVRSYAAPLPWEFDPQQLRLALWHLCLNAVEAMPDGGELRVGAARDDRRLQVCISDTGPGLEGEDLAHLFEPFFPTRPGATGLGLALTHRIVKDHGGDIEVTSAPGSGTSFTLTLPHCHG